MAASDAASSTQTPVVGGASVNVASGPTVKSDGGVPGMRTVAHARWTPGFGTGNKYQLSDYATQHTLTGPVQTVGPSDAGVVFQLYNLIHGAVSSGVPVELPSSPWAGVRALDAVPLMTWI